jgi:hypothetical protein
MATFVVAYDLKAPGKDYAPVHEYLKSSGTSWHAQGSVWVVVIDATAQQIRDKLKTLVDGNDRVMVIRVDGSNWASLNMANGNEWMSSHVAK